MHRACTQNTPKTTTHSTDNKKTHTSSFHAETHAVGPRPTPPPAARSVATMSELCARDAFRFDFLASIALCAACGLAVAVFGTHRPPPQHPVCEPEHMRAIVIGDVHGCARELRALLRRVKIKPECDYIYFVGDIIGKGPDSIGALREVRALTLDPAMHVEAVQGNHEAGFLRWLDNRVRDGSFAGSEERRELAAKLSSDEFMWLRERPLHVSLPEEFGHVAVVHAGFQPGTPANEQTRDTMLTIRSINANGTASSLPGRGDGWAAKWRGPQHVIFGHDARRQLQKHPFATGIDSGAVYGNKLTALVLRPLPNRTSYTAAIRPLHGGRLLQVSPHRGSCARRGAYGHSSTPNAVAATPGATQAPSSSRHGGVAGGRRRGTGRGRAKRHAGRKVKGTD